MHLLQYTDLLLLNVFKSEAFVLSVKSSVTNSRQFSDREDFLVEFQRHRVQFSVTFRPLELHETELKFSRCLFPCAMCSNSTKHWGRK